MSEKNNGFNHYSYYAGSAFTTTEFVSAGVNKLPV